MNTATTKTASDETGITAATERLDNALNCICTMFAWVDPQPSEMADDEVAYGTDGLEGVAAFIDGAAGELESLMMRINRCKNMRELLAS